MSSTGSYSYQHRAGHKRGISETSPIRNSAMREYGTDDTTAVGRYKSVRQSLRPLPQPPSSSPPAVYKSTNTTNAGAQRLVDGSNSNFQYDGPMYSPTPSVSPSRLPHAIGLSRADSVTPSTVSKRPSHIHTSPLGPALSSPDLATLKKSTTNHLRTLSKFAQHDEGEDFSLTSPAPSVAGLHGRRQLKRIDSTRGSKALGRRAQEKGSAWAERNWIDKQRQFLQAYEYLCHIGEAKEWIEDVIHSPLPPIVQLEEALRDGVTLAEIVQALSPNQPLRIFRNPKLQFRHSDNIAVFFRFLAEIELPELFRFELIDLYEKKNIPKVIYCIHALSWLLYRKGIVHFRIGNLVGQLEFEHHELEEMQKGLDKAGISMPSFSGVGATFGAEPEPEPEPEPEESEEERRERELRENEAVVTELQTQVRGAMVRLGLGQQMQSLWDSEEMLADLQSIVRGGWARQIFEYRLSMKQFAANIQSAARGFLVRRGQGTNQRSLKDREDHVVILQSLVRARKSRGAARTLKLEIRREESGVKRLQSAIRGALRRKLFDDQYEETRDAEASVEHLQAAIRGMLQRREVQNTRRLLQKLNYTITPIQACARAIATRLRKVDQKRALNNVSGLWSSLQAVLRGLLLRQQLEKFRKQLNSPKNKTIAIQSGTRGFLLRQQTTNIKRQLSAQVNDVEGVQAVARGFLLRRQVANIRSQLAFQRGSTVGVQTFTRGFLLRQEVTYIRRKLSHQNGCTLAVQAAARGVASRNEVDRIRFALSLTTREILALQSVSRAFLLRKGYSTNLRSLQGETSKVVKLQGYARGWLARYARNQVYSELSLNTPELIHLQALIRAMVLRSEVGILLSELEDDGPVIAAFQSAIRGKLVREKFAEKKRFFKANMEKVVKVQSFVRARLQGEAYKSLTSGNNPPVGTVKGFLHLLNDSDFDFDEEVEFERLRKTVVQHVRQNEMADQYITQLDIKIALLVKNKITLDEVVKHQKHFGGNAGTLLISTEISSKDPFDLKALNKNSRRKLEHYQELFFALQTQPQYLARLFRTIRERATAEKEYERIKHLMMGLFGYAQKRREEYYLIKLITRSMKEEIDNCTSIKDYLRSNFFWTKLFGAYVKSPRDRKYMRDILSAIVKDNIIDNPDLDLESDPMLIYLSAIENEQLRTGQRSRRSPDIPREEAIRDEETKQTFIAHLQDLRDIADQFFAALEDHLHKMPYGVRYVAQQMFQSLTARFSHEPQGHMLQIVGHWVWKSYLQPALTEPEKFGVLDRSLSQEQRRNVAEVAKVLGQVAVGRLFGGENVFLQPLNSYVGDSIQRLGDIWNNLISVPNAEIHFDIDEFNDLYARTKPTLYIKMADIFSVHHLVAAELPHICPNHDDMLREVIRELGSAKTNEHELMNVSSSEICLTLNPKLHDIEDPDAEIKALFTETKRCVLYIIRVQSGGNLMEIMVKPITMEDEDRWDALVRDELSAGSRKRSAYSEANTLIDIATMSYSELKRTALENILRLEKCNSLTRHNYYQDLLNAIAVDIRTKHRRRIQRQRELEGVRLTLVRLNDQATYLEQQLKTYNDYIEQAMVTLQNKKGKKRFLMPFTKQWDHERELQRSGRVPKFGSFKYSAQELANRGILVSWRGYSERHWGQIDLTISSNEVGVFSIEGSNGSISMPGASAQVPLDDLLQAQFNGTQFLEFFGGVLRVNVNLFLHLIMRKFYKDGES
ncbi:hypothetical protein MMC29_002773 [Sticta canariensis]|nr:hypothetical protein [Sticta canariensis]